MSIKTSYSGTLPTPPAKISFNDPFNPEVRREVSAPVLRVFLNIADLWNLTEAQRLRTLGGQPASTYHNWTRIARQHGSLSLPVDVLIRISIILGIHQALTGLYSEPHGVQWLKKFKFAPELDCKAPLELILEGSQESMLRVRRYLEAIGYGAIPLTAGTKKGNHPVVADEFKMG
jgi:hypothetical protein